MSITTSTGAVLESTSMTEILDRTATRYGMKVKVFRATLPDGKQEYVMVENGEPIYASQNFEFVASRIEMMHLADTKE